MSTKSAKAELENIFNTHFEDFEKSLNGLSEKSTHEIRKSALDSLNHIGFPGNKHEEYKYTPLTRQLQKNFRFERFAFTGNLKSEDLKDVPFYNEDAHIVVLENGVVNTELSKINGAQGLEIMPLKEAFKQNNEALANNFGKHLFAEKDAFAALNTAFAENGAYIHIKRNTSVAKPIVLLYITTGSDELTYHPRNLIVAEENCEVNVIECFTSLNKGNAFINQSSEVVVEKNARFNYFKLQNESESTYHIDNTQVVQHRDSLFNAYTFTFDGALIRNNLNIALEEEHCEAHMYGLYLTHGKTHVDNHTVVDHKEPNSFSNEIYKGIVNDHSKGVFNGKIFVRQPAQKTNAFQSNKNILLSDNATVNTKPQLEIWADDVKCSHGCTTGQLDDESLFYLRSRGISEQKARNILLHAFASDVLEHVSISFLKEHVEYLIHKELD